MSLWIDQVPSLPTIGVCFGKPWFGFGDVMLTYVDRIADRWGDVGHTYDSTPSVTIDRRSDRMFVKADVQNVVVAYRYHGRVTDTPGHPPSFEMNEMPPASVALSRLNEEITYCVQSQQKPRPVRRIGFMFESRVDGDAMPPGLEVFLSRLGFSVGADELEQAECTLLARVSSAKDETSYDQCHHRMSFDRTARPGDVRAVLDYQRVYATDHPFNEKWLRNQLAEVSASALGYVERFGAGEWVDG